MSEAPCPVCRNGDVLENPQGMCPKCEGVEERRYPIKQC